MPAFHVSTIRFTDEDRAMLVKLRALTGLTDNASAIRVALRDSITMREALTERATRGRSKGGK